MKKLEITEMLKKLIKLESNTCYKFYLKQDNIDHFSFLKYEKNIIKVEYLDENYFVHELFKGKLDDLKNIIEKFYLNLTKIVLTPDNKGYSLLKKYITHILHNEQIDYLSENKIKQSIVNFDKKEIEILRNL
ncbi:MAG: hypothetical protein GY849_02300 [Deltaproteobacteria bacterium]|nr:hypothetical protein [Deltaproteobacteria bacterium]